MDPDPPAGRVAGTAVSGTRVAEPPGGVMSEMAAAGVVPVVTLADAGLASPVVDALAEGGLAIVEITLRTPEGLDAIRRVSQANGETVVGAGSIRTVAEAHAAVAAGARFLVSPGLDDDIVHAAIDHHIVVIPGVATPTELMRARALGLDVVKFFPAEASGGAPAVAALSAAFPEVRFLPTGGIATTNVGDYLRLPSVLAVGGSWMVSAEMIENREWASITHAASTARDLVSTVR